MGRQRSSYARSQLAGGRVGRCRSRGEIAGRGDVQYLANLDVSVGGNPRVGGLELVQTEVVRGGNRGCVVVLADRVSEKADGGGGGCPCALRRRGAGALTGTGANRRAWAYGRGAVVGSEHERVGDERDHDGGHENRGDEKRLIGPPIVAGGGGGGGFPPGGVSPPPG